MLVNLTPDNNTLAIMRMEVERKGLGIKQIGFDIY
jgi:hypothetical protein